jgi:hypothetical protein
MAIDVPEQAMKIKEKRLFDIIDYQQEVILKLEDSETPMRGPHFKAMLVCMSILCGIYYTMILCCFSTF